jgi:preprotein translocase subunit SecA
VVIERIQSVGDKRPIIIFFSSANELYTFYHSPIFTEDFKNRCLILTEEHDPSVRDRNVHLAASASKISLMTKAFGRGTDFQVLDKGVYESGGIHIIQTFLSHEEAEEIQIKGRTNRQNSPGSVDIIYK